jgi:hypothetical protein
MTILAVLEALMLTTCIGSDPESLPAPDRIPQCGVASTYAVLRLVGRPAALADLEHRFETLNPRPDLQALSLAELRAVLSSYGLHSLSLRIDPRDAGRAPCPAILFIRPVHLPNNQSSVGHFLVLCSVSESEAEILDLSTIGGFQRRPMSVAELAKVWDGELLAISATPIEMPGAVSPCIIATNASLLAVALALVLWCERNSIRRWLRSEQTLKTPPATTTLVVACLLVATGGCSRQEATRSNSVANLPLIIENPDRRVELPRGSRNANEAFSLRAWDKTPVEITDVTTTCGCTAVTPDLVGCKLEPDSTKAFHVAMNVLPAQNDQSVVVQFFTQPPSPKPMTVTLHATARALPTVVPSSLISEIAFDSRQPFNVRVTYFRRATEAPLALQPERSTLAPFVLDKTEVKSEPRISQPEQIDAPVVDTVTLSMSLERPLTVGLHEYVMHLAWCDGNPDSVVPVRIQVRHPLAPSLGAVFCGELSAGQKWTLTIPLAAYGERKVHIRNIKSVRSLAEARLNDAQDALEVNVNAPQLRGRFEDTVVLSYDDPSVPDCNLRVTGVVP